MHRVLAIMLTLLAACSGDGGVAGPGMPQEPDAGPLTASYRRDIAPVFIEKCIPCHYRNGAISLHLQDPFDPQEGLYNRLNIFPESAQRMLLVPGKPEESFLFHKVSAPTLDFETEGDIMPYIQPDVTAAEIEVVRTWIADGAKNDAFFKESVAPIFGTALKLDARRGKCVWCHSAISPFPPNLIDPFDAERGVVGKPALFAPGATLVEPGDPEGSLLFRKIGGAPLGADEGDPMPMDYPRLTPQELGALEQWIREGALNN